MAALAVDNLIGYLTRAQALTPLNLDAVAPGLAGLKAAL
jgi:hypothetical protein